MRYDLDLVDASILSRCLLRYFFIISRLIDIPHTDPFLWCLNACVVWLLRAAAILLRVTVTFDGIILAFDLYHFHFFCLFAINIISELLARLSVFCLVKVHVAIFIVIAIDILDQLLLLFVNHIPLFLCSFWRVFLFFVVLLPNLADVLIKLKQFVPFYDFLWFLKDVLSASIF